MRKETQHFSSEFESPLVERRANEDTVGVLSVRKQKLAYLRHIVRHDGMEKRVLEAHSPRKRSSRKARCRWDRIVKETFGSKERATIGLLKINRRFGVFTTLA